ncbi:hypothetical protein CSUI_010872, partial [Cystoisospora suis]
GPYSVPPSMQGRDSATVGGGGNRQAGYEGGGPGLSSSSIPIKHLTAYVAKWCIRARVDVK